jgi:hypothetical protein
MENSIETRLSEFGIALPPLPTPLANYLPFTFAELIEYRNDFQDAFGNDDHAAPAFETAAVA